MKTRLYLSRSGRNVEAPYSRERLARTAAHRYSYLIPYGATYTGEQFAEAIEKQYCLDNRHNEFYHAVSRQCIKTITRDLHGTSWSV